MLGSYQLSVPRNPSTKRCSLQHVENSSNIAALGYCMLLKLIFRTSSPDGPERPHPRSLATYWLLVDPERTA